MESRHQQPVGFAAHSPALPELPSQQIALHSSLAGPAHQLHQPSFICSNQHAQVAQQAHIPSNASFGSQQPQASDFGAPPNPIQPSGLRPNMLQPPGLMQASEGLQLPLHVQQWLAVLANNSQQGTQSLTAPKQCATSPITSPHVSSADAAKAATEMHEDVRQLRAELSEVKSKFAETQAMPFCCADTLLNMHIQKGSKDFGDCIKPTLFQQQLECCLNILALQRLQG